MQLARAVRANRIFSATLGWDKAFSQVAEQLGFRDRSPGEEDVVRSVASWQSKHGLNPDGILGPKTWRKLEPLTRYTPSSSIAMPARPTPVAPPRTVPVTRGRLLVSEGDVTAGALERNDAYDLALYELSDGNYELSLFMKIQFFFKDGEGGSSWTPAERSAYMQNWKRVVSAAWSVRRLLTTKSGRDVSLTLSFELQEGGFMFDHWEIEVTKVGPGRSPVSEVKGEDGNVHLDSLDLSQRRKAVNAWQTPAVHEFGHMLGLRDEYRNKRGPHYSDEQSIMHHGSELRGRHLEGPRGWVIEKVKAYGIE